MSTPIDPAEDFRQAIHLCRAERWREGLELLTRVAQVAERRGNLPGMFYSYLGRAMARCQGRRSEGMELCRHAVRVQPEESDNHLNLAYLYLALGRRRSAIQAMERGLELHPTNERLLALQERLGMRRAPPLGFIGRSHPVNVIAGQARHWVLSRLAARRLRREEEQDFLG